MLVESVPNYSEGRRPEVVHRLADAVRSTDGAHLLDRTSDASHNRSVLTLAGEAPAVERALEATIEVAIETIDMERHTGEHPRIGAVDVIPFVPLGSTTLEACVVLARGFGLRIAERFGIPVYLYARAATRPDRVRLADVRRGGYEGVRDDIGRRDLEPDRLPDFGPRIARRVRESGGGLPAVQANGFMIDELDAAQVSMNLLDFETTPMWRAFDEVSRLATEAGVGIRESELIGLAPQAAFDGVAAHAGTPRHADAEARFAAAAGYLRLRDADPLMVLEQRLEAVRSAST
jgi:glutamate formiminotransferase